MPLDTYIMQEFDEKQNYNRLRYSRSLGIPDSDNI